MPSCQVVIPKPQHLPVILQTGIKTWNRPRPVKDLWLLKTKEMVGYDSIVPLCYSGRFRDTAHIYLTLFASVKSPIKLLSFTYFPDSFVRGLNGSEFVTEDKPVRTMWQLTVTLKYFQLSVQLCWMWFEFMWVFSLALLHFLSLSFRRCSASKYWWHLNIAWCNQQSQSNETACNQP